MTDHQRKMAALAKLAIRRQATIHDGDFAVYLEDIAEIPVATVERACDTIGREPRREYETAFPALGDLLKACRVAAFAIETERIKALVAAHDPKLLEAKPVEELRPLTADESKRILGSIKERALQLIASRKGQAS